MLHFVAFVYFVFTSTSHNRAHILQGYFFVSSLDWSVLKRSAACCSVLQRCHSPNWEICQFVTAISHAISVTQTNMNHVESSIYFSNRFKKNIFSSVCLCVYPRLDGCANMWIPGPIRLESQPKSACAPSAISPFLDGLCLLVFMILDCILCWAWKKHDAKHSYPNISRCKSVSMII